MYVINVCDRKTVLPTDVCALQVLLVCTVKTRSWPAIVLHVLMVLPVKIHQWVFCAPVRKAMKVKENQRMHLLIY